MVAALDGQALLAQAMAENPVLVLLMRVDRKALAAAQARARLQLAVYLPSTAGLVAALALMVLRRLALAGRPITAAVLVEAVAVLMLARRFTNPQPVAHRKA